MAANSYMARILRQHGASNTYFTLNNAAGSGKVLYIYRIWMTPTSTGTVSGGTGSFHIERYTGTPGGGTATSATVVKFNTAAATLPAQVTLLNGNTAITGTLTSNGIFKRFQMSTDEVATTSLTWEELSLNHATSLVWDSGYGDANIEPIIIREGFGLRMVSNSAGTYPASTVEINVEFTSV